MRSIMVALTGAAAIAGAAEGQSFRGEFGRCSDVHLDPQTRIAACTAGASLAPTDAERGMLLFYQSDARLGAGDYDAAISDADGAAMLLGENRDVLNAQCWTRAVANRELDRARAACDASLALEVRPAVLDSRGLVSLREGKWQAAWDDYDAAFTADPTMTGSLYGRGLAALALGMTSKGEADIKRAASAAGEFTRYGLTPSAMKAHAAAVAAGTSPD
jgi:tetratricopeptide (TPR) repeat protein